MLLVDKYIMLLFCSSENLSKLFLLFICAASEIYNNIYIAFVTFRGFVYFTSILMLDRGTSHSTLSEC